MHRKTAYICYFMGLFACGFETRGYAPHGSCATHHASPLACVLRRTAYRQKFPISFAQRACFLDFCRNTVSPPRQLSPHEITQTFATFCLCLTGCNFFVRAYFLEQQKTMYLNALVSDKEEFDRKDALLRSINAQVQSFKDSIR